MPLPFLLLLAAVASSQQPAQPIPPVKRLMTGPDDYKNWEALANWDISGDGRWIWYQVAMVDGDGYVICKNNDDPRQMKVMDGGAGQFSDDSKWFACLEAPPKAEAEKLRDEKKPIEAKLVLRNLESGAEQRFDSVVSFRILKGGKTLVARRYPSQPRPDAPSDALVINLTSGNITPINSVTDGASTEDGALTAFVVQSGGGDAGLELFDAATGALKTLYWGKDHLRSLTWAKKGNAVAFLAGKADEKYEGDFNRLVEITGLPASPTTTVLDPSGKSWLPKSTRISETGAVEIDDDGAAVGFGIGDWFPKHKVDDKVAHPEIWNSKDLRTVPQQRVSAPRDRARTDQAVWWPTSNAVQMVSHGWQESAALLKGFRSAVVIDAAPYASAANDGFEYADVDIVDTLTGKRTVAVKKTHWSAEPSLDGHYLAYYKDKNWWIFDIQTGQSRNATESFHTNFEDTEDDHTVPEKPSAGSPVWLAHDQGLIVADDFDSYYIPVHGAGVKLTNGRHDHTVFRFTETEAEEDGPDGTKPLYFTTLNKDDKRSGYFVSGVSGKGKTLVEDAARITGYKRAKNSDRAVFELGTFERSPNLFITNLAFTQAKPETHTNPQQANYYWPRDELVTYKSRWGEPLQGILMYPANYQPGHKYPMITYIYERLSDGLYNYPGPNDANAYNAEILLQNGYFVFEPDIAYRGANPGENAVDCLEPAVAAVLAKNVGVMPDRIGLMGHSWGAYQTAFVTTVSSVFKVGCAGAPLTDLVSMYNTHYWNVGMPNQPLLETGQGRLRVPFWEDPKTYIDNSPVWQSMKRKAPILITVGDQDGAVDYHQGIALYNTLRRMGKDCVLLVYYGENHGFTKRPDQLDYGHRLRHFMDVYLKEAKPEPWISQGIPFLKKDD